MRAVGLRSSRNRELGLLLLVAAVVAVGFTSVLVARSTSGCSPSETWRNPFPSTPISKICQRLPVPIDAVPRRKGPTPAKPGTWTTKRRTRPRAASTSPSLAATVTLFPERSTWSSVPASSFALSVPIWGMAP